ncbi:uncharacterized protein [Anabrus simplex]|uniref:uncharacterized protein n=1 Tax=Anabrus simplex TaxID=316456 RepID=UPI0034DCEDEC
MNVLGMCSKMMPYLICLIFLSFINGQIIQSTTTPRIETWTGRWLPERPAIHTDHSSDLQSNGIRMGVPSSKCDDAKTNLTVDWDYSPVNYTCYHPARKFKPDRTVRTLIERENIPKFYVAQHKCMDEPIYYSSVLPTFGTHRPLWPRYGEYKFVPKQRWLHNLEHGAIVMLYHPCANPLEVNRLRQILTGCLRRHIITPDTLLSQDRPLALLAWGWRMTMSVVQPDIIKDFIKQHALQGPEAVPADGLYDEGLLVPAKIVSNIEDYYVCPHLHL